MKRISLSRLTKNERAKMVIDLTLEYMEKDYSEMINQQCPESIVRCRASNHVGWLLEELAKITCNRELQKKVEMIDQYRRACNIGVTLEWLKERDEAYQKATEGKVQ